MESWWKQPGLRQAVLNPAALRPGLIWDTKYGPASKALMSSISNTLGVNTIEDCPVLPKVRAVRLAPNGQAFYRASLPAGRSIDLSTTDMMYCVVTPNDTNTATGTLQIGIYLASDFGGITNRREYRGYCQGKGPGQSFVFGVPLQTALVATAGSGIDGYSASSGVIDMTSIKTVGVQVKTVAAGNQGADNYFYVSDIFFSASRPKGLMLGFDKQFASVRDNALPLLDAAGVKCTLYVSKFEVGTASHMTLSDLQTASNNGHKIALHSYSKNLDTTDAVNFPTAQSIADEITAFESWAAANSLNYIPHHAAIAINNPWDASATFAREVLALQGYMTGGLNSWREGNSGLAFRKLNFRLGRYKQPNVFTTPLHGANQTDIETLIQNAADRGGVVSLYSHECLVSPGANDTTPTMVSAVIAKAQAAGVPFITPNSW